MVEFALGVSKEVDPLSGMTVNLKTVLQWLDDWKSQVKTQDFSSWQSFFERSFSSLQKSASEESAQVSALQVRFFDHSQLRYQNQKMTFSQSHLVASEKGVQKWTAIFLFEDEAQLKALQKQDWSRRITDSADQPEKIFSLFGPLKPFRIEIQDPETEMSLILNNP